MRPSCPRVWCDIDPMLGGSGHVSDSLIAVVLCGQVSESLIAVVLCGQVSDSLIAIVLGPLCAALLVALVVFVVVKTFASRRRRRQRFNHGNSMPRSHTERTSFAR